MDKTAPNPAVGGASFFGFSGGFIVRFLLSAYSLLRDDLGNRRDLDQRNWYL